MLELIVFGLSIWLVGKVMGLALKLTWGVAKGIVGLLIGIAVPVLFVCLVFVGGLALLIPLGLLGLAFGIVKACVS